MAGVDSEGGRKQHVVAVARVCAYIHSMEILVFGPMVDTQARAVVGGVYSARGYRGFCHNFVFCYFLKRRKTCCYAPVYVVDSGGGGRELEQKREILRVRASKVRPLVVVCAWQAFVLRFLQHNMYTTTVLLLVVQVFVEARRVGAVGPRDA